MCCEDRGDVDVPLPTERNGDPSLPFVEMRHDGGSELPGKILDMQEKVSTHSGTRGRSGPRQGTRRRHSQKRYSRSFRDRWGVLGSLRDSRDRLSIRQGGGTGYRYRREERGDCRR